MTDLIAPPEDPAQLKRWARNTLKEFSLPENRHKLSANLIRADCRKILKRQRKPRPPKPPV